MSDMVQPCPPPIDGTVFSHSRAALRRRLLRYALWIAVGVGIASGPWMVAPFNRGTAFWLLTSVCTLVGGICALAGAFMIYGYWPALALSERVIIGRDRLQLVVRDGEVIGQIPYDNIAEMGIWNPARSIKLRLIEAERADTLWPNKMEFKRMLTPSNFDLIFGQDYEEPAESILEELRKRFEACLTAKGLPGPR
jgi:hypothetical protein